MGAADRANGSETRHLVLVGLMGAGKTTVGQRCAELLDMPFLDTDQLIEANTRMGVADVFANHGEHQFRTLERDAVLDASASPDPLVIACGGGAVLDPENRRQLRAHGVVVWLRASPSELGTRVGDDAGESRPLLASGALPEQTLARLIAVREPAYEAAAHVQVDTDGKTVDDVAATVVEEYRVERVTVALPDAPYDVVVGAGVLADAGSLLGDRRRIAVVSQPGVADFHAPALLTALQQAGVTTDLFLIGDGEDAKSLATVDGLCSRLAEWGLLRDDAVVALGGGVVGDTAGFAASVYHRGVDVVQAPTTLLAQVDAAIGGKTAVNLPEGKNLVGAFHQPLAVYADVTTLATLPPREYRAGLGEVAKYALMPGGERVGAIVEQHAAAVVARDVDVLTDLVAACAAMKAHVVGVDPHERTGLRATLNLGHTLAHALESVGGYELLHGEAVAVGLVFAGALAGAMERIDADTVDRYRNLVSALDLPTAVPDSIGGGGSGGSGGSGGGAVRDDLLASMRRDKKSVGGLTFVLPGPVGLETVHDPDPRALDVAFAAVGVGS